MYALEVQISGLTPDDIRHGVERARARVEAALAEYEAANAELAWWQQGLQLVDPNALPTPEEGRELNELIADLFHGGEEFFTGTPSLRQAIAIVMRDSRNRVWTIADLTAAVQQRGWLRTGPEAQKRVSDMAAVMYRAGLLSRVDRGEYKLSSPVEAALDARGSQK